MPQFQINTLRKTEVFSLCLGGLLIFDILVPGGNDTNLLMRVIEIMLKFLTGARS